MAETGGEQMIEQEEKLRNERWKALNEALRFYALFKLKRRYLTTEQYRHCDISNDLSKVQIRFLWQKQITKPGLNPKE